MKLTLPRPLCPGFSQGPRRAGRKMLPLPWLHFLGRFIVTTSEQPMSFSIAADAWRSKVCALLWAQNVKRVEEGTFLKIVFYYFELPVDIWVWLAPVPGHALCPLQKRGQLQQSEAVTLGFQFVWRLALDTNIRKLLVFFKKYIEIKFSFFHLSCWFRGKLPLLTVTHLLRMQRTTAYQRCSWSQDTFVIKSLKPITFYPKH